MSPAKIHRAARTYRVGYFYPRSTLYGRYTKAAPTAPARLYESCATGSQTACNLAGKEPVGTLLCKDCVEYTANTSFLSILLSLFQHFFQLKFGRGLIPNSNQSIPLYPFSDRPLHQKCSIHSVKVRQELTVSLRAQDRRGDHLTCAQSQSASSTKYPVDCHLMQFGILYDPLLPNEVATDLELRLDQG